MCGALASRGGTCMRACPYNMRRPTQDLAARALLPDVINEAVVGLALALQGAQQIGPRPVVRATGGAEGLHGGLSRTGIDCPATGGLVDSAWSRVRKVYVHAPPNVYAHIPPNVYIVRTFLATFAFALYTLLPFAKP